MINKITSLLVAGVALNSSALALTEGDLVTLDALHKADAIQGDMPKAWEPGKVYFLECWATWCSPCVAAIPHLDAQYDKYKDKGLRVIGVNVKEDGKDKVAEFVRKKGEGMSYPVLYTGKEGSAFDTEWLKANGADGIPQTFVVKDGKFLFRTHPQKISDDVIEALLAGGEKQESLIKRFAGAAAKDAAIAKVSAELAEAETKGDTAVMMAKFKELGKLGCLIPGSSPGSALIRKKDWNGLEKLIPQFGTDRDLIIDCAWGLVERGKSAPDSVFKVMLVQLKSLPENDRPPIYPKLLEACQKRAGEEAAKKDE